MKKLLIPILGLLIFACSSEEESSPAIEETVNETVENTEEPEIIEEPEEYIPMDMNFRKLEEIPAELDYDGNLVDCYWWNDKNGENYFVRSLEEPVMAEELGDGTQWYEQYLHAYHYILTDENSDLILKRDLLDFVKECEFDMSVSHLEAIELNDADEDNYGEVTFGYWLACRSDVSPSEYKVFTFEDGEKYGLRGYAVAMGYGGEYEVGKEYDNAPEPFLDIAKTYWEANKIEFE